METYSRIRLLRSHGNLQSYWATTKLWKLAVVLEHYEAIETNSHMALDKYVKMHEEEPVPTSFLQVKSWPASSLAEVFQVLHSFRVYFRLKRTVARPQAYFQSKMSLKGDRICSENRTPKFRRSCSEFSTRSSVILHLPHSFRV
jgi:hypothetical protein